MAWQIRSTAFSISFIKKGEWRLLNLGERKISASSGVVILRLANSWERRGEIPNSGERSCWISWYCGRISHFFSRFVFFTETFSEGFEQQLSDGKFIYFPNAYGLAKVGENIIKMNCQVKGRKKQNAWGRIKWIWNMGIKTLATVMLYGRKGKIFNNTFWMLRSATS